MHTAFATDARESHAAEWCAQIAQEPAIDPRDACTHLLRYAVAALQLRRPDRGGESVVCVVGHGDGFVFGIEWRDVTNGSEDLFFHATRGFRQSGEDSWLDVSARVARVAELWNTAASHNGRTF